MRALIAAASLVMLAVMLFGGAPTTMFTAPTVHSPMTSYHTPGALVFSGTSGTPGYAQSVPVANEQLVTIVQPITVAARPWGWSDVAMLAAAGAVVGAAVSNHLRVSGASRRRSRSTSMQENGESTDQDQDWNLENLGDMMDDASTAAPATTSAMNPVTSQAALAVSGETVADLETLAKGLNPGLGFWDPLNLAEGEFWNQSNEATIGFLRHAEIKHGRVAMAGFVGYCVHANGIHFPWKVPGDELCAPGVSPPELWQNIPAAAKWQILLTIGLFEFYSEAAMAKSPGQGGHYMRGGKPGLFPAFNLPKGVKGQSGIGTLEDSEGRALLPHPVPLNLYDPFEFNKKKSDEWKATKLRMEINNGRLAMIGLMSLLSEGAVPGSVPALKGLIPATGEINVMSPFDFTKPFFG
jgi:hypothetical protein